MTILDEINANKRREVEQAKAKISVEELKLSPFFKRSVNSLKAALKADGASGIIAEFKTKSPSKGVINDQAEVTEVTSGYVAAGVSGLSVLTDEQYFGGSFENLAKARMANPKTPVLRKDFMLDPYQVYEAKAHGADLILLIAASLSKDEMLHLSETAKALGLEVLVEVHTEEEIEKLNPLVDLVGVNNRNLKTFEVDLETSVRLSKLLPAGVFKISESGLSSADHIHYLRKAGFKGFLMGENFMKTASPGQACADFIKQL
ncbi:indole-3-glycerol phosphate synthase TrpC [Sunxiuqinia dokdonensis]|uniref:indole-3-glycerol-phosphate synthase n=1 Tax=Sunxiuqinia dokdonensis TaxID=1409788 RepID=A0A0L8VD67_9BACT|nr:indole-3-glycerol phosphate synthase TrpC [Sunxiuqinia dokdonensis]KOH46409.1 indole-3-glycerol-phosphate synthase [Sunxiuqinia dokdonensis]